MQNASALTRNVRAGRRLGLRFPLLDPSCQLPAIQVLSRGQLGRLRLVVLGGEVGLFGPGDAEVALDLTKELAEPLAVLVVDAGDGVLLDPLPDLVDHRYGMPPAIGEEDERLTAVADRRAALDIILRG